MGGCARVSSFWPWYLFVIILISDYPRRSEDVITFLCELFAEVPHSLEGYNKQLISKILHIMGH